MQPTKLLRTTTAATLAALILGAASDAAASRRCRDGSSSYPGTVSGYGAIKAGGYALDAISGTEDDLDGLFLGFEWGVSPSPYVDMGFTVDWLHRSDGRSETVILDAPYELPVSGALELGGSSTNLVPMGGLVRLRMPVADGRIVPFVSGQLTWDVLRLEYREAVDEGDYTALYEESEYFTGWGTSLALGLVANLDGGFGLLFEAGTHLSEPTSDIEIDGVPVEAMVDADGEFARIGMRFAFR